MHDKYFDHEPRGEFRGDVSRDSYDPFRHFSRVLMQQGRVQLDADWNEQVSIFWHFLRALARDIGGEHWVPWGSEASNGFKIILTPDKDDLLISQGPYYVQGVRCENHQEQVLSEQHGFPFQDGFDIKEVKKNSNYLVYLDAWERHLTAVEDDYMREVALAGPDTATRSQIVWQVNLKEITDIDENEFTKIKTDYSFFLEMLGVQKKHGSGLLRARAKKTQEEIEEPCLVAPDSRYRGDENQLYRVEIHKPGETGTATFKWSRENGAVVFPIVEISGTKMVLEHLGRDSRFGLDRDDWVEIVDDHYALKRQTAPLLQVETIDLEKREVTLKGELPGDLGGILERHPYLRRWDHTSNSEDGDIGVVEMSGEDDEDWILLENGVQIQFPAMAGDDKQPEYFQTGDYWIIPARTATGDVQWPNDPDAETDTPNRLSPHGVKHYYAPLAVAKVDTDGNFMTIPTKNDLRRKLKKPW